MSQVAWPSGWRTAANATSIWAPSNSPSANAEICSWVILFVFISYLAKANQSLFTTHSFFCSLPALVKCGTKQRPELFGDSFTCPENPAAHGTDRASHRFGNFIVAKPFDVTQGNRHPQLLRQCIHCHIHGLCNLLRCQHRFRRVDIS